MSAENFNLLSWGRFPRVLGQTALWPTCASDLPALLAATRKTGSASSETLLARGLGRSYGDACLNEGGILVHSTPLNHLLEFSLSTGIMKCEAGVSFAELLDFAVPRGFFVPVTPGTKFITVGGAIANDVHGKNHHWAGNFGSHLIQFELARSDGSKQICSRTQNSELFFATIGGLGLTGFITWAEFHLKKIAGPWIDEETVKFTNLDGFFKISEASEKSFEYTVAWIDCLASGKSLGRGLFFRGNHSLEIAPRRPQRAWQQLLNVPFDLPPWVLSPAAMNFGNRAYYSRICRPLVKRRVDYDPFFYPLDAIANWNRLYGKPGFLQYQFVVPFSDGGRVLAKIMEAISRARMGSFLAVLKIFGTPPSQGIMSFPKPGVTLALDFPNKGKPLLALLDRLDQWVVEAGGRIYPAKDARMSSEVFRASFENISRFVPFVDPGFSSSFWRRVFRP